MLKHLIIKNYALIKHLEMEPSGNLNVITGETGAGKSIMLGAVGMLMGNRADTKVLWDENEKCIIEATFDIKPYKLKKVFRTLDLDYEDATVIRREISANGKSRAFVNDTPVTLDALKTIGKMLMDIHSQHETLELGSQLFQLQLIDAYAGNDSLRAKYEGAWDGFTESREKYEKLKADAQSLRDESEYVHFQLTELQRASLADPSEQESLEAELSVMEHSEEIKTRFASMVEYFSNGEVNATQLLSAIRQELQHLAAFSPSYEALLARFESARIELEDISDEIKREQDNVEVDPKRITFVQERLSDIYRLEKKHKVKSIQELLEIQSRLAEKDDLASNLDEALAEAEKGYRHAEANVRELAEKLSASRRKVIEPLSTQMVGLLKELGIPDANVRFDINQVTAGPNGWDRVEILFSANKGLTARPLASVASGGEFSRVMFAIKYILANKTAMPTLILDEIDNGVSGEIAIRLGSLMKTMSQNHQLITISHLPQIAAKGDRHYFVYKDNSSNKTVSKVRLLSDQERVEEIAKMIGGEKPTKIALENAQELLAR